MSEETPTFGPISDRAGVDRYGYWIAPGEPVRTVGRGEHVRLPITAIVELRMWRNVYGNPSYGFRLSTGWTFVTVDDYGGENDLGMKPKRIVDRKKDLA